MAETITCPNCEFEIELSEALSKQLREQLRKQFEAEARKREQEYEKREDVLRKREHEIIELQKATEDEIGRRLDEERKSLTEQLEAEAAESVSAQIGDLQTQLTATKQKLELSQSLELQLRKKKTELEEKQREFDITLARQLDEERSKIRDSAKQEVIEERKLKEAEKDKLISDLQRQIGDLKRKSEQGSQQLQGEVMELELETFLSQLFPQDSIEPVAKGVHGGDVRHVIYDHNGLRCGSILWESKRTKNWSDGWLPKLRDDQRSAKAEIAVLASIELPPGVSTFDCIDGVWVTSWACIAGLATALRQSLIDVARSKQALVGQQGKMELLYNYLAGSEFRQRIEGIVEAFVTMKNELDAEKRAVQRLWAKREKQLERAIASTAGLHGDLSGIIGGGLLEIEELTLPALPGHSSRDGDDEEAEHD